MSWDIFVQDLPPNIRTVAEVPDTFQPRPLGNRGDLIRRIKEFAAPVDFSDPSWGLFEAPTFSVEFNLGDAEVLQGFALHVRGDDAAAGFVSELLSHLDFRALDPQSDSGLFEAGRVAEASLQRWREYRNRVIPPRAV